jgi:hypothetical protein
VDLDYSDILPSADLAFLFEAPFGLDTWLSLCRRSSSRRTDFVLGVPDILLFTRASVYYQVRESSKIALIRSIWIWVSFARCVAALLCVLFSKFMRSSNILSDIHSVSSIFSDWLARRAETLKIVRG